MHRGIALLLAVLASCSVAQAGDMTVEAAMAKDQDSRPTDTFPADVPKLYCFFKTKGSEKGDKLRAVWIADDVGDAAPADTKIDETTLTADTDNFFGAFSLTQPTKGWPPGKYHVDLYSGDDVIKTVKFTIKSATKAKKKTDDDEHSSDD